VRAQAVPRLALDLVDARDDAVQAAVLIDPLRGGLVADAGDAGQVVAAVADQGRLVAVALGGDAVLGLDGLGGHPPDLGDAAHRVEDGDVFAGELERVPVAGGDDDLHAQLAGLAGQGADDVVGLVAGLLHDRDAQRLEDLLDQADLAQERRRGLRAAGLVVRVLLGAERHPGDVEGDHDVRRPLVAEHVDQHRGEAEHSVGGLTRLGGEVLHRQGEIRPVGQRVTVEQQQAGGLGVVTHVAEL
jgi:hypothetical protein